MKRRFDDRSQRRFLTKSSVLGFAVAVTLPIGFAEEIYRGSRWLQIIAG